MNLLAENETFLQSGFVWLLVVVLLVVVIVKAVKK